ncbi:hypothetical protein CMV_013859 [Castanea mollissima]|uniref:Major facilitator superfamily (MFS) profile domain-containing protein n=1 Tax=Castanea mollissima TaxID=60419 RepID=A0A8J4R6Y3_9ROSI|nr:hypothetical protein CMV_013859 [Castanea mollissima]
MGSFTDAYNIFCISTVSKLLGRLYYAVAGVALIGTLTGHLFFGWIGDKLGREKGYSVSLTLTIICAVCSGLSFDASKETVVKTLCFFRFWQGLGIGGNYPISAVIMSEYSNEKLTEHSSQPWQFIAISKAIYTPVGAYREDGLIHVPRLISVTTPAIAYRRSKNITSLARKRVVVHVRHHADHLDDVLHHDHEGDVLRHEHDEHVVDVLHRHDNALLLLNEDHDHDNRDAHRHHDNALLFRRDVLCHDHVLHDVPQREVEYDDDFRGETFSKVLLDLESKLDVSL